MSRYLISGVEDNESGWLLVETDENELVSKILKAQSPVSISEARDDYVGGALFSLMGMYTLVTKVPDDDNVLDFP